MKLIIDLERKDCCDGCPYLWPLPNTISIDRSDAYCPMGYTDPEQGIFVAGEIPVDWEWTEGDGEEYPCHPRPHQCIIDHGE